MSPKPIPCTRCLLSLPTRTSLHQHHQAAHADIYCEICSTFIAPTSTGWEKASHMYLKHRIRIPFSKSEEEEPSLHDSPAPERKAHCPHEKVKFDPERLAAEAVFPEPFTGPNAYTTSFTESMDPNGRWDWNRNQNRNRKRNANGRSRPSPTGNRSHHQSQDRGTAPPRPVGSRPCDAPPDHYAVLGVKRLATHAVIVAAAKAKRIECHPDRVKRKGGLSPEEERRVDERAMAVGFAAEVLGDRVQRKWYEEAIVEWEVSSGLRW